MDDADQIAAFVAAADELHLGRAAATLGLTRATLARRLRALESRLDLCLVDRRHRCRISLTPAGAALLPDARRMVAAATQVTATAQAIRDGRAGVVRVALISGSDEGIAALLRTVEDVDPGWSVDVRRMDRWAAGRAMAIGGLEVVIGRCVVPVPTGPSLVDPRPSRQECMRGVRIGTGTELLCVSWRASWAGAGGSVSPGDASPADGPPPGDGASPGGSSVPAQARVLIRTAVRLRNDDLDMRFPRRAAQLRAIDARREAVAAETELRHRECAELGAEVALERAQDRTRVETVRRYRDALAQGAVDIHLAIDYWATEGPDRLYWATVGAAGPPPQDEPDG